MAQHSGKAASKGNSFCADVCGCSEVPCSSEGEMSSTQQERQGKANSLPFRLACLTRQCIVADMWVKIVGRSRIRMATWLEAFKAS